MIRYREARRACERIRQRLAGPVKAFRVGGVVYVWILGCFWCLLISRDDSLPGGSRVSFSCNYYATSAQNVLYSILARIPHAMTRYREARRACERIRQRLAGPVKAFRVGGVVYVWILFWCLLISCDDSLPGGSPGP